MISGVRLAEIVQCARCCVEDAGITSLPVDPKVIATQAGIGVIPWKPTKLGISGILMRVGDNFGIGYSTAIANKGFENFTIAHELGHYFLAGHPEALFAGGNTQHLSHSGYVSEDKYEREADAFAAELLMPESLFEAALRDAGAGFAAIKYLADLGQTSLVSTAIRFAKVTGDPVAVLLSSGTELEWSFISKELAQCRGVRVMPKGTALPVKSATARFNSDAERVLHAESIETHCSLREWFFQAPETEFQEDVVGLGHYGKTLTVLFTEEALADEDEEEEATEDCASGLPSSRWRSYDRDRRSF